MMTCLPGSVNFTSSFGSSSMVNDPGSDRRGSNVKNDDGRDATRCRANDAIDERRNRRFAEPHDDENELAIVRADRSQIIESVTR